jgi:hypothetical protein
VVESERHALEAPARHARRERAHAARVQVVLAEVELLQLRQVLNLG